MFRLTGPDSDPPSQTKTWTHSLPLVQALVLDPLQQKPGGRGPEPTQNQTGVQPEQTNLLQRFHTSNRQNADILEKGAGRWSRWELLSHIFIPASKNHDIKLMTQILQRRCRH